MRKFDERCARYDVLFAKYDERFAKNDTRFAEHDRELKALGERTDKTLAILISIVKDKQNGHAEKPAI